ncbi:Solute carrier family 15 member 2 like protein [Argiope bruennichi]|uniref:Solute carrier family 15 member 2 like protein n=1 Tax=Argiope bruennichi TaxID=94029 RepID=A0A8T0FF23_ARGBR|nr:Solute carrier family 15 member 2 like protein [Argiope bruennichi]
MQNENISNLQLNESSQSKNLKSEEESLDNRSNEDQSEERFRYPPGIPFILTFKFGERFSFYAFFVILTLYLHQELDFNEITTSYIFHTFMLLNYLMPIFGALLADAYLTKFWTMFYLAIIFIIGKTLVFTGSILTNVISMRVVSILGIVMISVTDGGLKPCASAFGGDQFEESQYKTRRRYFSIYFFVVYCSHILASFLIPVLRSHVQCFRKDTCYPLAFGTTVVVNFLGTTILFIGKPFYRICTVQEEIFIKVFKCIGHALSRKFKSKNEKKKHWLDYAEDQYDKNLISDIKILFHILQVYIPLPVFLTLFHQVGSTWVLQASKMDGELLGYHIKPDQMVLLLPVLLNFVVPTLELQYKVWKLAPFGCSAEDTIDKSFRLEMQFETMMITLDDKKLKVFVRKDSRIKLKNGNPRVRLFFRTENVSVSFVFRGSTSFAISTNDSNAGMTDYREVQPGTYDIFLQNNESTIIPVGSSKFRIGGSYIIAIYQSSAENKSSFVVIPTVKYNSVHILCQLPQYIVIAIAEVMFAVTGVAFSYAEAPVSLKAVIQAFWFLNFAYGNALLLILKSFIYLLKDSHRFFVFGIILFIAMLIFMSVTSGHEHDANATENDFENDIFYLAENRTEENCNKCGIRFFEDTGKGRIINGRAVLPVYKYPWIVSIFVHRGRKMNSCGGALISANFVLTAAHCLFRKDLTNHPLCFASRVHRSCFHDPKDAHLHLVGSDPSKSLNAQRIIGHPKYSFRWDINDIALIHLSTPVECSKKIMPICLPDRNYEKLEQKLMIAGSGYNTPEGTSKCNFLVGNISYPTFSNNHTLLLLKQREWRSAYLLREGLVKVVDPNLCRLHYHSKDVNRTIICIVAAGQVTCHGDSGSAMFGYFEKHYYALGITSTASTNLCDTPDTFTKDTKTEYKNNKYDESNNCDEDVSDLHPVKSNPIANETSEDCRKCGIHLYKSAGTKKGPVIPLDNYPWVAHCVFRIELKNHPLCFASRVHRLCFHNPKDIHLSHTEYSDSESLKAKKVIGHPKHGFRWNVFDIALIQLSTPVKCSKSIFPICLPAQKKKNCKKSLKLVDIDSQEEMKDPLHATVVNPRKCQEPYYPIYYYRSILCIDVTKHNETCHGESGSALFESIDSAHYAVGITPKISTIQCEKPNTYMKISFFMDWIKLYVGNLPKA